jgi:predicted phage terminase large subunit-like protein
LTIQLVKPDGDKYTKAVAVTPATEGGRFFVQAGAAWAETYRTELTAFPGGAHDDLVDATVQALTYLREAQDPTYWSGIAT